MNRVLKLLGCLIFSVVFLLGATAYAADEPKPTVKVENLDLHDGQIAKFGDTYYQYGTMYGCGYEWYIKGTPWCGFGVSTSSSINGPWSTPTLLFGVNEIDPFAKMSWMDQCGKSTGQGCFNPRMIQRTGWGSNDGAFILWFNSPVDFSRSGANAYNVMGCNSPTGPCGPNAGPPFGSYAKPSLDICSGNGDFGIIQPGVTGQRPAIVCTMPGATALNIQEMNYWGSGGNPGVGVRNVAGLIKVEGPGGYWDADNNQYVLTFSDPGCGYCAGTAIGYATAPSLYSGWTSPSNPGFGQPLNGRRTFHPNSCGGQPRTVSVVDGTPYQGVDLWLGTRNETDADKLFIPLDFQPTPNVIGQTWIPPLQLNCNS